MKHLYKKLDSTRDELIMCTGLPGHRSITRENCGRRYLLARRKFRNLSRTGLDIEKMSSLEICSTCPEGMMNAKTFGNELIDRMGCNNDFRE